MHVWKSLDGVDFYALHFHLLPPLTSPAQVLTRTPSPGPDELPMTNWPISFASLGISRGWKSVFRGFFLQVWSWWLISYITPWWIQFVVREWQLAYIKAIYFLVLHLTIFWHHVSHLVPNLSLNVVVFFFKVMMIFQDYIKSFKWIS